MEIDEIKSIWSDMNARLGKNESLNKKILNEIETSSVMENLWKAYQKNYSYAVDISWHIVMESVRYLYQIGYSVDF